MTSGFAPQRFRYPLPLLLALVLVMPGCALLRDEKADGDGANAASTSAGGKGAGGGAADAAIEPPANPVFDIRVDTEDKALKTLVERHNELQRYRAIADLDEAEFARLMAVTESDVRNLLGTEGYFNPQIKVQREPATADGRPTVVIAITPGTATTVKNVNIEFEGDIAQSADSDAATQRTGIVDGWGLDEGRRFTQDRWSSAKTGALRQLVERRYPRGRISYSVADISAPEATAKLGVRLDSGPLFRLGAANVKGAERYPAVLAERLSWLKPGDIYDQKKLVDAQQRLAGSGYYDSAYISIDPEGDPNAAPVTYNVREAKRHKVQLGVGYSTDSGPRVTLEHRDNQALGTSWRADTKLNLNLNEPLLQTEWTSLPRASGWRWAALARYMRQDDGALYTTSQTLRVGSVKTEEKYDRNIFLQYDHARVTGSGSRSLPSALLGDGAAVSLNYAWTGRYFNTLPVPTAGYGLAGEIGAGITTAGERKPFMRLNGRWLGMIPIGGSSGDGTTSGAKSSTASSRIVMRAEAGAVLASKQARLPSTYMFRTGGDTTVRGYGYRKIGIDFGDDLIGPGRYMGVGSVEWQRPIFQDRFPGLLEHTLFIDVGGVANEARNLRAHWGVGTGIRLITPVGPMELDLAYGLQSKAIRLHMTVGFVF